MRIADALSRAKDDRMLEDFVRGEPRLHGARRVRITEKTFEIVNEL